MAKNKTINFLKKYHKWPSLVLTIFIILFSLSGIVMNHRDLFSSVDVNRKYLGSEYQYQNWNKAAVKSALQLDGDSALIYGNIGVWLSPDNFQTFQEANLGFPKGMDNRKIEKLFRTHSGDIYAGTLLGLYTLKNREWQAIELPVSEKRVVDFMEINNNLYVLTRSHLLKRVGKYFEVVDILADTNYKGKVSLFKTLWQLHSGEAFGNIGKIFVDFIGFVFLFLCFSGLIYFFFPKWIKRLKKKGEEVSRKIRFLKFNLKWHNHLGNWLILFLVITTLTGMFLRPPLLIAIINSKVDPIPHTQLDNANPWHDHLRRILYDKELKRVVLATNKGVFYSDDFFASAPVSYRSQPPISVMGVNVFEQIHPGQYLIGSFSGLFYWIPDQNLIIDYISKQQYVPVQTIGPPISAHPIAGYLKDNKNREILFDYNIGAANLSDSKPFTNMPTKIQETRISLWNLCLEVHTGRIYQYLFGKFYILFIPLAGLTILWILIGGFWLYWKKR